MKGCSRFFMTGGVFVLLFLLTGMAQAYITVSGNQSGTWMADSTYYVSANVTVPNDNTLIIPKGVVVKFNTNTQMTVNGTLSVDGSQGLVYFTSKNDNAVGQKISGSSFSPSPSDWKQIYFSGSESSGSVIDSCIVRYGTYGISLSYSDPVIRNSTFRDNGYDGINCSRSDPTLTSNLITANRRYGICLDASSPVISNCNILNNGTSSSLCPGIFGPISSPTIQYCVIMGNTGGGIVINGATNPVTISWNEVSNNGTLGSTSYGIYYVGTTQATISYNYVSGHSFGIVTSYAQVINNIITGNGFPLALTSNINTAYNGNTITANTYNTAIGIFGNISGTLYNPSNLPSPVTTNMIGTYPLPPTVIENGTSLTIQPGALISTYGSYGYSIKVYGFLSAIGKADSLIKFTKISPYISGPGANSSVLDFCQIDSSGGITISDCSPIIQNSSIMRSSEDGIVCTNSNANLSGNLVSENRWHGISLTNSSPVILNCRISKNSRGGTGGRGIEGTNSSPTIQNCLIENNAGGGIYMTGANNPVTISGDTISNNGISRYGIYYVGSAQANVFNNYVSGQTGIGAIGIVTSYAQVNNNVITGNTFPLAVTSNINSTYSGNTITGNTYNTAMGVFGDISGTLYNPSYLASPITTNVILYQPTVVNAGDSLTIQSGAVIKFLTDQYLTIKGTLRAVGKTDSLIAFTSFKDDSLGGDSNSDGGDSLPAPRNWKYLSILDSSSTNSVLDFCMIRYAEQSLVINSSNPIIRNSVFRDNWIGLNILASNCTLTNDLITSSTAGGIYIGGTSSPYIYKCDVIANGISGSYYGIYSISNSSPRIRRCNILNNTLGGVRSHSSSSPVIDSCNIYGNSNYGVNNEDVAITLKAQYNWWGDSTGPSDTSIKPPDYNPNGLGDKVSDYVTYRPWLTSPFICGDNNGDENVTLSDIVFLINYIFKQGAAPDPLEKADANGDGSVTLSDIVYLIVYLFKSGSPPKC